MTSLKKEMLEKMKTIAMESAHAEGPTVDEDTLSVLVKCLDEPLEDVVLSGLEVLFYFSTGAMNRPIMANFDGLLQRVKRLMVTGRLKQKKIGIATYGNLQASTGMRPSPLTARAMGSGSDSPVQDNAANVAAQGSSADTKPTVAVVRSFTLSVPSMQSDQTRLETFVVGIKGVVSVVTDYVEKTMIIRGTIHPDDLILEMKARMSVDATLASDYDKNSSPVICKENRPEYLEEIDEPSKGWFGGFKSIISFGASDPMRSKAQARRRARRGAANSGASSWLGNFW